MADIYNMSDVFLSYSRRDAEFVHRLFDDFKSRGKEVWADFEDIPKAADWWQEIQAGINAADAFIFIISPDSVMSDVCRQEIEHAVAMNKRFLPVLYRDIVTDEAKAKMHSAISSHNWIYFREQDDYDTAFNTLLQSIETDLEHNRISTRLLVRAREWDGKKRDQSYLLRDQDLEQAEAWLSTSLNKKPSPTNLHAEYINVSRMVQAGRQRRLLSFVSAGFVVALLLAVFAAYQTVQAQNAQRAAEESAHRARTLAVSASSNQALANGNLDLALVLAQNAAQLNPNLQQAALSLSDAAYTSGTRERIPMRSVVNTVVYAPDGSKIASGLNDGNICIYTTTDFTQLTCLGGERGAHDGATYWIHMNTAGTRLLSSGSDERLILWDIDATSPTYSQILQERTITGLTSSAMDETSSFAVFGLSDGRVGRWNFADDEIINYLRAHADGIRVIAIEAGGQRAVSGSDNGIIVLWNLATNGLSGIYQVDGIKSVARSVTFSPDGNLIVAGYEDATLRAWSVNTGQLIRTFQGHDSTVTAINFSSSGRTMFTSSWDNSLIEWDISSGRVIQSFNGHTGGVNGLSLSADNDYMVSGGFDSSLRIWRTQPYTLEETFITDNRIRASDYYQGMMILGHENGSANLLDSNTGTLIELEDHSNSRVASARFNADGTEFVILHADCVLVTHAIDGSVRWSMTYEFTQPCNRILYRPLHAELALLASDGIHRINIEDGTMIGIAPTAGDIPPNYSSAEFTPDGLTLVVGSNLQTQNLHEIEFETGEVLRRFVGHTDGILAIDLTNDGLLMVSGSFDNEAILWDMQTGLVIAHFEGHSDRVTDVGLSSDGRYIASASNDRTVRLWDIESGFNVFTYIGHTDRVIRVHFSEAGDRLLSASYDATVIRWRMPQSIAEMLDWVVENRYLRTLTCTEERLYLDSELVCE